MFVRWVYKFFRAPVTDLFLALLILAVLVLSLARPVSAASSGEVVVPAIEIVAVKADESVTVRGHNFPEDVRFTVRMDVAGNLAVDGIVVTEMNSGKGGSFEATYRIPAELRGKQTIAIRLESSRGYYAYDWFVNKTKGSPSGGNNGGSSGGQTPSNSGKPYLNVLGVKANESVTVEAFNLPANTDFRVRVGPFYTFAREQVQVTTVRSGSTAGGSLKFTVALPDIVDNADLVTIRIDGGGRYAYNAFHNVDSGTVSPSPTPAPSTSKFQVVSVSPNVALPKGGDFDAVWTIKNTSNQTWELNTIDYRYVSGVKMHNKADRYDLVQVVKPGETVKVIVDMIAPNSAGWHTANWELVQGSTVLGKLSITVRVK